MIENLAIIPDSRGRAVLEKQLTDTHRITPHLIGKSILGREIRAFTVGKGARGVLYVGTHHSLEAITANILYGFLDRLLTEHSELAEHFTLTVVPCLNPDGVELHYGKEDSDPLAQRRRKMCGGDYSRWQANARGVDLNHNYSEGFYEYKEIERERKIEAGASLYSGEYPESEPETASLCRYIRVFSPCLVLSLHSQGECIYYSPKTSAMHRLIERAERICAYKLIEPGDTDKYGGLCDYTGALGIPSLTVEVGRGKNPLDISNAEPILGRLYPLLSRLPLLI